MEGKVERHEEVSILLMEGRVILNCCFSGWMGFWAIFIQSANQHIPNRSVLKIHFCPPLCSNKEITLTCIFVCHEQNIRFLRRYLASINTKSSKVWTGCILYDYHSAFRSHCSDHVGGENTSKKLILTSSASRLWWQKLLVDLSGDEH